MLRDCDKSSSEEGVGCSLCGDDTTSHKCLMEASNIALYDGMWDDGDVGMNLRVSVICVRLVLKSKMVKQL